MVLVGQGTAEVGKTTRGNIQLKVNVIYELSCWTLVLQQVDCDCVLMNTLFMS
jgi:hypothetical protein